MPNQEQFTSIYNQQYANVFRLCKGYFNGNEALAADVAQEVFIKVWQHLDSFRHEAAVSTWIYRIAVNSCLLYLRKPSTKKELTPVELPERADEQYNVETEEKLQKMYACIQKLEEQSKVIILLLLEGLEYDAIAQVAGTTQDTLRVKIHRIKKQLSNCVQL